ncbi:MAG: TIR domain-containing protein [Ktedonobacteraceae bacterium]
MERQQKMLSQRKNASWIRFTIVAIAIIFFMVATLLWILNTGHIIQGDWSYIFPILFVVLSAIFALCQWLLPITSGESNIPDPQIMPRQSPPNPSPHQISSTMSEKQYPYDVAISYAGEDHTYAETLADTLSRRGIKVFFDKYEKSALWGKNLYTYLSDLYLYKARYCVMFLSQNYADKLWTNHEREAAQARAFFNEHEEYILPIRLDHTDIPGILPTISYLSWPPENAETIADLIAAKLVIARR